MASSHHSLQLPLFTALLVLLGTRLVTTYDTSILKTSTFAAATCFTSIFSFGDSHADSGNLLHYLGDDAGPFAHLFYGETYFHNATGRYSDGRLIIDFIAQSLGLPLVPPYLAGTSAEDFRYGANFAVAGATALDNDFSWAQRHMAGVVVGCSVQLVQATYCCLRYAPQIRMRAIFRNFI